MTNSDRNAPAVSAPIGNSVSIGAILDRPTAYQVAQACAALGWRVLPLSADGKKQPLIKGWPSQATTDLDVLAQWFADPHRTARVCGVLTGTESGIWVLDVDRHNGDGFGVLAGLEGEHGALPPTFTVRTPRGGEHRYWTWPAAGGERAVPSSQSDGLDVRGWHGQVAAPETWYGGRHYAIIDPRAPVPAPGWLVEWARTRRRPGTADGTWTERDHRPAGERAAAWVEQAAEVAVGNQHDYLFSRLCALRALNVNPVEMHEFARDAVRRFVTGDLTNPWTDADAEYQANDVINRYPPGGTYDNELTQAAAQLYARALGGAR